MAGKISIPIELKERHKTLVFYLGEVGAVDRKVLLELFTYSVILEQQAKDGIEVLYDYLLSSNRKDAKLPFKFNMLGRIFDQELFALVNMLGLVKRAGVDHRGRSCTAFELTEAGKQIHEMVAGGRRALIRPVAEQRKFIFVIGDFRDKQTNLLFEHELAPACLGVGYKPVRFDSTEAPGTLSTRLFQEINSCELMLVDLTALDSSIFFQLGYAFGLGVQVVFTCRVDRKQMPGKLFEQMPMFNAEELTVLYWGVRSDGTIGWQDGQTPEMRLRKVL